MELIRIIRKNMFCPLCGEDHTIEILTKENQMLIEGEEVVFPKTVYVCRNSNEDENEFIPAGVMDRNIRAAQEAYYSRIQSRKTYKLKNLAAKHVADYQQ